MQQKPTTEDFVERATLKHGGKYSYARAAYINAITKVTITCPEHGDFTQTPNHHLGGRGCRQCGDAFRGNKKLNAAASKFIEEATRKHHGKFTYENAEYLGAQTNVLITCPLHGEFPSTPSNHLKGRGCPRCADIGHLSRMRLRATLAGGKFAEEATRKHEGKYTYAHVAYLNARTEVVITCPLHGDFRQTPNVHLSGGGCLRCSGFLVSSTAEFVKEATKRHEGKYSYDRVVYVNSIGKVWITCPEHGDFQQPPNAHLIGHGCPKCAGVALSNTEEFKAKAVGVHGGRYTYGSVVYVGAHSKVLITCSVPGHGDFKQTPQNHLLGNGCQKCAGKAVPTTAEFIERAIQKHKGKYSYARAVYVTSHTKLEITCAKHGDFKQAPGTHLQGVGCPKCDESRGEVAVCRTLDAVLPSAGIEYLQECRITECRHKKPLPFDFALIESGAVVGLIEYHGQQHYAVTRFRGISMERAERYLASIQQRDAIKVQYAAAKGIPLLVIPYRDFCNIESLVTGFLQQL
jgi:hypothetical protein